MRKGQKMSEEQKLKLSKAHKGRKFSDEHRKKLSESHKGNIPTNLEQLRLYRKGRPLTEEHKRKLSESQKGKSKTWTQDSYRRFRAKKQGVPTWNKGMIGYMAGDKNPNWIADRSKLKPQVNRMEADYQTWRRRVKQRDGKKCRLANHECCGQLEVHHILSFRDYPELRYELSNGITLCHFHHPRKKKDCEEKMELFQKLIED